MNGFSSPPRMTTQSFPFRWAILGTGGVSRKFVLGLRSLDGRARPEVVASRNPENARRFAATFDVPRVASYAEASAHPEVDFVYVATPPVTHEEHAMMAIDAGKPVLIEKPFALDAAAARRIVERSRDEGVFCMEGMWTRFLPLTVQIRRLIESGELGEPRAFEGGFVGNNEPDGSVGLFDPGQGGGALMHRGIYPLSLARHFLGPVATVRSSGRIGATGVDEDCSLVLEHETGAISTVRAGLRAAGTNRATVYGSRATVEIGAPIYRPSHARMISAPPSRDGTSPRGRGRFDALREGGLAQGTNQRLGRWKELVLPTGRGISARFSGNGYGHEAHAVAHAVTQGWIEHPVMPLAESIELMETIDRARAQWWKKGDG
ncbi:Gfo/Idh/MocA family oxidoreductase [Janibacter cremeus]|uniref:Gfo/Idh/MocA family protein n=1 Tax=Janibacter cremeus TaxID=1285192 RepID=UPI0023F80E4C|nr:Gfo/Idh/MocA family oxidoreductase [Janibacter cremeus]WEV76950.1 Gfo/Idh/MocA family oxidoreductase [Janibacter cremeus]